MTALYSIFRPQGRSPVGALEEALSRHGSPVRLRSGADLVLGECGGEGEPGDLLAADLRLDNRRELLAALPHLPPDASDRRLVLEAWRRWGEDCFRRLRGDFALLLYDPDRRVLVAAVDPFAVRRLLYVHRGGTTLIASEAKALLAAGAPLALNRRRLALLALPGGGGDTGESFFQGIRSVPGGCFLRVDESGARVVRHFDAETLGRVRLPRGEWAEACREAFLRAVEARARTNGPLTVQLSGGLDSSSVAAAAREVAGRPLPTVCSVSPDGTGDEREFAAMVDRGVRLVDCRGRGPFDRLGSFLRTLEHPMATSRHYVYSALYEAAGGGVVLDGAFGELGPSFHGDGCLAGLVRRGRVPAALAEAAALARAGGESLPRVLLRELVRPFLPTALLELFGRGLQGPMLPFRAEFMRSALGGDLEDLRREAHRRFRATPDHRALMRTRVAAFSGAAGPFGLDPGGCKVRFPFLDLRLLDLCIAAPAELKVRRGLRRGLIRSMMEGLLPDEVRLRRSKGPFAPGYHLHYEPQREQALRFLEGIPRDHEVREIVDVERLIRAAREPARGPTDPGALHLVPHGVYLAVYLLNFHRYALPGDGQGWVQPVPEA